MVGILITNGGPHPASKLAEATVDQLIVFGPNPSEEEVRAGMELRAQFQSILEGHHASMQIKERAELKRKRDYILTKAVPAEDFVEQLKDELLAAAAETRFADHFSKPEVQEYIKNVVRQLFHISMDIERSWHADRNPDMAEAREYREKRREAPLR